MHRQGFNHESNAITGYDILHVTRRAPLRLGTLIRPSQGTQMKECRCIKWRNMNTRETTSIKQHTFVFFSYCNYYFSMNHHQFYAWLSKTYYWVKLTLCCGSTASWQKASAEWKCVVLITTNESTEVLALTPSQTTNTLYDKKQVWPKARQRWGGEFEAEHRLGVEYMHNLACSKPIGRASIPESVCFPGCKHNDVPSNRANTNRTDRGQHLRRCTMTWYR